MPEFSKTVKMNTLISTSTSYYIIIQLICLMNWSFLEDLLPNETYNVDNIKYTNFISGKNTKSTNLQIHEFVIFNQTKKIDAHEEKYFHSNQRPTWLYIHSLYLTRGPPSYTYKVCA